MADVEVWLQLDAILGSWLFFFLLSSGQVKKVQSGVEIYNVTKYADLDKLLRPKWFIRGFNENGDFCYAVLDTIH